MGFIGKIFKNKQIVTIIALILCFGILVFAYRYRVDKAINAVSVPIATRRLEARELIDETCFQTKKVAQSMLTDNVITNTRDLLGDESANIPSKYVNYNTFIPEGSLFYKSAVTTWSNMPDSAWSDIEEGNTVFSLKIRGSVSYANSIFPGDRIDLYFHDKVDGKPFIGPLINGIKVLAVKDESGNHIFKKGPNQKDAKSLIFSVPDDEFLFLKRADAISTGEIIPVIRNAEYNKNAEEEKGSEYIRSYIERNSRLSNDNSVKSNNKVTNIQD